MRVKNKTIVLAAVIGAAICIPIKNGLNNLYDVVFSDMMNSSEGVKMSICSLLAINYICITCCCCDMVIEYVKKIRGRLNLWW